MKQIVQFETIIPCSAQTLFDFHANTENLTLITPPNLSVQILHQDQELKEGNEVELKITRGLLTLRWKLFFETITPPSLLVDVATKSPFQSFRHEHRFIAIDDTHTLLRDTISFSLPFGWFSWPVVWLIKRDLSTMFEFRHHMTKQILSSLK